VTEPRVAFATPVFTVNNELVKSMARDCTRLEIDDGVEGLKTLRLTLKAVGAGATGPPAPMYYLDGKVVDFGSSLAVAVGPEETQRIVFEGKVSALEAVFVDGQPPLVVVSAEDALMRLRMTRRMRTYRDLTDAEIADAIAKEHGLSSQVDAEGPRYDVVQQVNQSDLAFLRERARLIRAELWCSGNTLHFATRTKRQGTKVTLVQGNHLLDVRLCADLAHQRTEVAVTGYDARTAKGIDSRAGRGAISAEAARGRVGADVLEKAFGPSVSLRVRESALTLGEAEAFAKAEMLRRARAFVSVTGTTRGSPDMIVGSTLDLQLVGAPFEGAGYYVTRVRHIFDLDHGLRTRFEAERPTLNEAG
jgi:phage protein D